ncbi:MAG: hypothetical protein AAF458_12675 [Pseudomonadota bacterium]
MQPFYFMLSVWGRAYCDFLLRLCIPSLLAGRNIPALPDGAHKFLIACPPEDWEYIAAHPVLAELRQYCEPVHLEIPAPTAQDIATLHMGKGHILATERCSADGAYGVALTPDLVLSDGTVEALVRSASSGKEIVLVAALRFAEEPLLEQLSEMGIWTDASPLTVSLTGRQLVSLGMAAMHPETAALDFDAELLMHHSVLPATLWRVPQDGGVVVHSLSWAPLLIDYAAIGDHDISTLQNWTMDGDYIFKNFGIPQHLEVCRDSDEMMIMSWGPSHTFVRNPYADLLRKLPGTRRLYNAARVRMNVQAPEFDDLKRQCVLAPVRWHVSDIDEHWLRVEERAARIVRSPDRKDRVVLLALAETQKQVDRLVVLCDFFRGKPYAQSIVHRKLARLRGALPGPRAPDSRPKREKAE